MSSKQILQLTNKRTTSHALNETTVLSKLLLEAPRPLGYMEAHDNPCSVAKCKRTLIKQKAKQIIKSYFI